MSTEIVDSSEYKSALVGAMQASAVLEGIRELKRELTAYQIAKDNLELRLRHSVFTDEHQVPAQVY